MSLYCRLLLETMALYFLQSQHLLKTVKMAMDGLGSLCHKSTANCHGKLEKNEERLQMEALSKTLYSTVHHN